MIPRLIFLAMKAIKRLLLNVKTSLFLRGGAIQRGDGPNDARLQDSEVGRIKLPETAFEHFENWEFLKLLIFKSNRFSNRVLYFFRIMRMRDVTIKNEKQVERKL